MLRIFWLILAALVHPAGINNSAFTILRISSSYRDRARRGAVGFKCSSLIYRACIDSKPRVMKAGIVSKATATQHSLSRDKKILRLPFSLQWPFPIFASLNRPLFRAPSLNGQDPKGFYHGQRTFQAATRPGQETLDPPEDALVSYKFAAPTPPSEGLKVWQLERDTAAERILSP